MLTLHTESDESLLSATAGGDEAAFARLYRRYERRLSGYIRAFVVDRMVAEEVLVDVMTAVWFGARRYKGGSRVSTWILGIARHKALDAGRRRAVSRERAAGEFDPASLPSESAPPDEVYAAQCALQLAAALAHLSDAHREAIQLSFVEDLHYREISALLRVPVNTVKTRVFHAKQRLRQLLDDSDLQRDRPIPTTPLNRSGASSDPRVNQPS